MDKAILLTEIMLDNEKKKFPLPSTIQPLVCYFIDCRTVSEMWNMWRIVSFPLRDREFPEVSENVPLIVTVVE